MEPDLLFVYGTLKSTSSRGWGLDLTGCEYLGEALTKEKYLMCSMGFPMVFNLSSISSQYPSFKPPGYKVLGEVYRMNEAGWAVCDKIEGHPRFYQREVIKLEDGTKAWMYLMNDLYYLSLCSMVEPNEEGVYEWN